ncbi:hypothetical protein K435DRAFT_773334 [Dendrothele bispora CBS 962.96]|uniref:Microbial-type PARG catalytic domain-containing protein n=1 Tax=Dendrothele bispora (strain CBS 962.96) TaxID=1314807 RepID=A0A4S8MT64_DENBC|nr:hypothetical protein K435DRAFT_773334 [Dendrothele bispora CBS 962.96]
MAPSFGERAKIAKDTINRSPKITEEHSTQGATLDSTFISEQLPPLDPTKCPNPDHVPVQVEILDSDSFTAARNIMKDDAEALGKGKMAVLNLASDSEPGGGWAFTLSKTQEEALCYSSTLWTTLRPEYYPWPNVGPKSVAGVFSPGIVVFKDDLDHDCVDLAVEERRVVSVITVAAPNNPPLTEDEKNFKFEFVLDNLRGKIRLVYRMAAHNGAQYLVLGAMGCGVYTCPPYLVAEEMKSILLEKEFKGWFKKVVFAVYAAGGTGARNLRVFKEVFDGVKV